MGIYDSYFVAAVVRLDTCSNALNLFTQKLKFLREKNNVNGRPYEHRQNELFRIKPSMK